MSRPYIGFSNETLENLPTIKAGDEIICPLCGDLHVVADSDPPMLLSYECGGKTYLAGINGRLTLGVKSDVAGEL